MRIATAIVATISLIISSRVFAAPSFDCSKAKSVAEHAICASDDLAFLDKDLDQAYALAIKAGTTSLNEQRAWIQRRDHECKPVHAEECVRELMWRRFDELTSEQPLTVEATVMVDGEEFYVRQVSNDDAQKDIEALKKEMQKYGDLECSRIVEVPSGRENEMHAAECMILRKNGTRDHVAVCDASMTNALGYLHLGERKISFKSLGFFAGSKCAGG